MLIHWEVKCEELVAVLESDVKNVLQLKIQLTNFISDNVICSNILFIRMLTQNLLKHFL